MVRVLKADDLKAVNAAKAVVLNLQDLSQQARQIVLDARHQAAEILAAARADAKASRDKGRAEGLAAGLRQGREEGLQQALAQGREQLAVQDAELAAAARQILDELAASSLELQQARRRELLALAMELAARIVGEVATHDIAAAEANLDKVLRLAGRNEEIVVHVNPQQLRRLEQCCSSFVETLRLGGPVRVVGDEEIAPGGVKLISRTGEIDATIATQLANVAQTLLGQMPSLFEAAPQGQYVPEIAVPAAAAAGGDA